MKLMIKTQIQKVKVKLEYLEYSTNNKNRSNLRNPETESQNWKRRKNRTQFQILKGRTERDELILNRRIGQGENQFKVTA